MTIVQLNLCSKYIPCNGMLNSWKKVVCYCLLWASPKQFIVLQNYWVFGKSKE